MIPWKELMAEPPQNMLGLLGSLFLFPVSDEFQKGFFGSLPSCVPLKKLHRSRKENFIGAAKTPGGSWTVKAPEEWYCWWKKSSDHHDHQLIRSLSYYLQSLYIPGGAGPSTVGLEEDDRDSFWDSNFSGANCETSRSSREYTLVWGKVYCTFQASGFPYFAVLKHHKAKVQGVPQPHLGELLTMVTIYHLLTGMILQASFITPQTHWDFPHRSTGS